jgi:uncharacterized membrane protein
MNSVAASDAAKPRLASTVAIIGLALLTFFRFPGHTWLQQDTQIYVPILEHLHDTATLDRDLIVQYPHVSFTLYDEITLAIRKVTRLDLEVVLGAEQIAFRAIGIWGIYLLATAAGLDLWGALMVAAIFSLGAMIAGPSVLTFEYEPTPRAFAVPLVFCALGYLAHRRFTAAGIVVAAAFLLHPPTTGPFWIVLLWVSRGQWRATRTIWLALIWALLVLLTASRFQPVLREQQEFFARLTPPQEAVQRMRTAYNWISIWWQGLLPQYIVLYLLGLVAFGRVKQYLTPEFRAFAVILPALGMLSMPASYLLLEQLKWSLVPQLQPMRMLLFVTAFTVILGLIAALKTRNILESAAWLALAFYIPMRVQLFDPPTLRIVLTALGLAAFSATALKLPRQTLLIAAVLAFFIIPGIGQVSNYPDLRTAEIAALSQWARDNTPRTAMFLFPDSAHQLYPGIFRAQALRAVYVDWKSGGQVNYLKDFADEWRIRWEMMNQTGYGVESIPRYRSVGIDFLVVQRDHRFPNIMPVYLSPKYAVYRIVD